jgi:signal transduction histidine kinase
MLPSERTTRSDVVTLPSELEALVVAPGRQAARPLVAFMRAQKLNIVMVHDADSAFEEALLHRPHVVVIHDGIPPAGGIELCQRLKNNSRTHFLPAILFCHDDSRQERVRALAAGADAIFLSSTDEQERRTRLWALLRSQALYRRQERRHLAQGSILKERGRWIGSFVHDLQNSIGALQANFEYLAQIAAPKGVAASTDLEECLRESRTLFQQVARGLRTVRDYERFESGQVVLRDAPVPLEALVREARDEAGWHLEGARRAVELEVEAPAATVSGDPDFLKGAVAALAVCLAKQPRNTRVTLRTTGEEGGTCLVVVAGDGEPIAVEERGRLFEPYVRVLRRAAPGQGLSLALARSVIELHGGTIRVEAGPEGGTAFVVQLKSRDPFPKQQIDE